MNKNTSNNPLGGQVLRMQSTQEIARKVAANCNCAQQIVEDILEYAEKLDPDALGGGRAYLQRLDRLGVRGCRLWTLHRRCRCNLLLTLAVLRAWQLNYISDLDINAAIDEQDKKLKVDNLLNKVREYVPNFGPGLIGAV